MKVKSIVLASLFVIFALCSAIASFKMYWKERQEVQRVTSNYSAAMKGFYYYKTKSGKEASRGEILHLKYSEIKNYYPEIVRAIDDLKIKIKRVESVTQTHTVLEKQFVTVLKDSIVFDTLHVQSFSYTDGWNHITGHLRADTISIKLLSSDSLIQTVHRGKREKPWRIFSPRPLEQTISNTNPAVKIKYSRHIKISKR
jgi:hypothetical protein